MSKTLSKTEASVKINDFFKNIKTKSSKDVKKIKTLAMSFNIPLKEKRKFFCKKCLSPYGNPKIRIRNKIKSITCEKCSYASRWRINSS